jgi:hypothetical protein
MSPVDDDLRELLRRRADQVSEHREVPRALVGRARRRIAVNALGVGVAVVVLAGGAFAGVRAIQRNTSTPGSFSSTPPAPGVSSPSAPSVVTSACTGGQLRAVGSMDGAAGSREGAIRFTNYSNKTCTLQGTPTITLLDGNLHPITSGVTFASSPPAWQANATAKPAGWPVVTLAPFRSASIRVRWSNWCPQGRTAPLWRISIPGGGTVNANGMEAVSPPPCNGPGMPSRVERGPFEPSS